MGVMSIREFNANASAAFAKVKAGETIEVSSHGEVFAEIRPKRKNRLDDPKTREARDKLLANLREHPLALSGPATYDDRTAR